MDFKGIVSELLKRESGKEEVNAAQMNEVVSHLSDILYEHPEAAQTLVDNGARKKGKSPRELKKQVYSLSSDKYTCASVDQEDAVMLSSYTTPTDADKNRINEENDFLLLRVHDEEIVDKLVEAFTVISQRIKNRIEG